MTDHKALAEQLVRDCRAKGADAAEAYVETGRNLVIEVRNGELETVQEASGGGAGLRVFVKGRMAFASSNDLGEKALADTVARAVAFARLTTADPANVLPEDKGSTAVEGLFDPAIAAVPMDAKIELARKVEKLAMAADPRITTSDGARYREGEGEVVLANSHGLIKSSPSSFCSYGVSVVAEKDGQRSSGSETCGRRFFADLKPAGEVAAVAGRKAVEMLDPRPVKTQRAAVIFDRDVAYAVLGGILGAVNGESVLQGASFLGRKLGQRVASDLVTLIDDGTLPKGAASAPFDGEGVPTARRVIVDKGELRGFMYNTIVAKRAGVAGTGNASRGGFSSLPGIGPHNFFMAAGPVRRDDIIAATTRGLLLTDVTGYGINPVNGDFSGGAEGFWIEDGKVAFPVRGLTVAASADEMLSGIDMVADDLDPHLSLTAPTFRVGLMQIGGE